MAAPRRLGVAFAGRRDPDDEYAMILHQLGHTAVIGLAWGDEGKGKIVDLLAEHFDVGVRYNGGANAGHTVRVADRTFAFHALPSTSLRPGKLSVIGPGVALDLPALIDELDALQSRDIDAAEHLRISDRAHLVMPWHKIEDTLSEAALADNLKIGTTARGVGPCYADKMRRTTALRACDLYRPDDFRNRVTSIVAQQRAVFASLYQHEPAELAADAICDGFLAWAERLRPNVCDTTDLLQRVASQGRRILYEGANGTLLDVDHGTYPFVTSSSTTALGVYGGAGVPRAMLDSVIGVTKAYATRVGRGPFPTELRDELGDRIREQGREYGTTTGRPRRCGWFDAVAARYAVRLSGVDHVALMHLDTLSGLDRIGLCVRYHDTGGTECGFGADPESLGQLRPVYEYHPGWDQDLRSARRTADLPHAARSYVARLRELLGVPISMISVGPQREQTILG